MWETFDKSYNCMYACFTLEGHCGWGLELDMVGPEVFLFYFIFM